MAVNFEKIWNCEIGGGGSQHGGGWRANVHLRRDWEVYSLLTFVLLWEGRCGLWQRLLWTLTSQRTICYSNSLGNYHLLHNVRVVAFASVRGWYVCVCASRDSILPIHMHMRQPIWRHPPFWREK